MIKVFISYRRADSATISGRIYDRLVDHLSRKRVFKDVDDIPPGVDFRTFIQQQIHQATVLVAIIGPHWADGRQPTETRRIDQNDDLVRIEIESAFSLGLTVIPVLVEGAQMPGAHELPTSLQRLATIHALVVREDPDFARDMERLIKALHQRFPHLTPDMAPEPLPSREHAPHATPTTTPPMPAGDSHPSSAASSHITAGDRRTSAAPSAPAAALARLRRLAQAGAWRWPMLAVSMVVLAAVVAVVVSWGPLLNGTGLAGWLSPSSPSATYTSTTGDLPTLPAVTEVPITQTPGLVLSFPYKANAPGPVCDKGHVPWGVFDQSDLHCFASYTHVTGGLADTACSASCTAGETLTWGTGIAGLEPPSYFTISIDMRNIASNTTAFIGFEVYSNDSSWAQYQFDLTANGSYQMVRCSSTPADNCLPHWHMGTVLSSGSLGAGAHIISLSLRRGGTVAWEADGATLAHATETPVAPVVDIYLGIDTTSATPAGQADFADFTCASV